MWIVYSTKPGDTMDTIIAKQRIKDPATVLTHKDNKKIYKELKTGAPLPKGTKVTIPDPKGKVYAVPTKSGVKYMDEKSYKDYLKVVNQKMDEVVFKLKQTLSYATGRHDAQLKINKDQWFVAACLDLASRIEEPTTRKKAESAFKSADTHAKSRNYRGFEKSIESTSIAIATYNRDTMAWIDGLINAGEGTVTVLEGVRTVGMVCGAVAATTIIAPVGLAAGVLTGAGVGGGTQLAYDGFDSIGNVIAGTKPRSTAETLKRAAGATLTGAGGALVVGLIMKAAGPHIIRAATSNKFLEGQVKRILSRGHGNLDKIYAAEVKAVVSKLGIKNTDALIAARGSIMGVGLTKFLLRVSMGSLNKYLGTGNWVSTQISEWIAGDEKRVGGKSADTTGKAFAKDLAKSDALDPVFDKMVKDNEGVFAKILRQEIKAAALVELKKEKA